ncbi:MAG: fimbrillin family protein [Muribaculaceae bacterium]|nr:fimbrillin family protein [Muribaculaceae bacterium]
MKKASKYLLIAALALPILGACVSKENEPAITDMTACPEFTATIADQPTRAFDQQWEAGDVIGISGANRANVAYITNNGNGRFSVKTSGDQIYFQEDGETAFTAYYPWTSISGGSAAISADTKKQADMKSFDFLWAQASGKKDAPNVTFSFAHRMAKVVLTVRPGTGMSYDEIKNVGMSMTGVRHSGSFNTTDGSTTVTGENGNWAFTELANPNDTDNILTFSFIFFPQTFNTPMEVMAELSLPDNKSLSLKAPVDFTGANREKDGANARNEWVAGRQYNLSLTLNKTEIALDQCMINPWTVVNGEEITVD